MAKDRNFSPDTLAWRIDRRLTAMGKSPTAASVEAGLSASGIRNIYDTASKSPRSDTIQKLAPVLRTSVEWLSTGLGKETVDDDTAVATPSAEDLPEIAAALFDQLSPERRKRVLGVLEDAARAQGLLPVDADHPRGRD